MAEIRPYKENYFTGRKKVFFILALILVAAAAVLAVLFFRSAASPGLYVGNVVRISGSSEDIGLVKTYREGKSITYYSAASGFKDLVFHPLQGLDSIRIIAVDAAAFLKMTEREKRAWAEPAVDRAEEARADDSPPPPMDVVAGDEEPEEFLPTQGQGGGETEEPAMAQGAPVRAAGNGGIGYSLTRETGVNEYDREVSELATQADEIDSLWQKHRDFCQGTIAVTVGNAYGREWFGIYTTINAADTPECRMMISKMQVLAEEIDIGMEAAWEKAHRAGVYPGQIRAIQQKYGMELERWNKG